MSAWGDFSTSDTLFGVGRSDACAVGRSGESLEAPWWHKIKIKIKSTLPPRKGSSALSVRGWVAVRVCSLHVTSRDFT